MAEIREGQLSELIPDDKNMNRHTPYGMSLIEKSIRENGLGRSILVDKDNRIIGGNGVVETAAAVGMEDTIVVETTGDKLVVVKRTDVSLDSKRGRSMAMADNATALADIDWDVETVKEVAGEWGVEPQDWGVDLSEREYGEEYLSEEELLQQRKREFEERMAAGELSEDDPEYQAFLEKFEAKKTTDDCYTPEIVYDAVSEWVAKEYGVSRANFVRPFYPQGDYQREKYKPNDIVVDNPPFSILAEILRFYNERGIRFFLFAPTLTLFSSSSSTSTALPCGVTITYENGAQVHTSFLTNLDDKGIRLRSCPTLYADVKAANDKVLQGMHKSLPKYAYDHHIVTSTFVAALSRLGIDFSVPVSESEAISVLDAQRDAGKAIYGKGYIVGDRVFAEREKAEREKAERWELSEREKQIVKKLTPDYYYS